MTGCSPARGSGCTATGTWRSSPTSSTGRSQHKDSMGNGSIIQAGELQRMTAGTGVRHSEFNPSDKEWVHLYQIWLLPERKGLKPSYEELAVGEEEKRGRFRLVASPDGADGSLTIHQDARLYLASLLPGQAVAHADRAWPGGVAPGSSRKRERPRQRSFRRGWRCRHRRERHLGSGCRSVRSSVVRSGIRAFGKNEPPLLQYGFPTSRVVVVGCVKRTRADVPLLPLVRRREYA